MPNRNTCWLSKSKKYWIIQSSILKQLVESSRNKLLLWGMSTNQVNELARTKNKTPVTTFYSPSEGYIIMLESHEGDYVSEGTTMIRLNNLSTIRAEAQVYESQLSRIDRHGAAIVQLPDIATEIRGRIDFINPEINPATRVNLIRVTIPNPARQLKTRHACLCGFEKQPKQYPFHSR